MNAHESKLAELTREQINELAPIALDNTLREAIRSARALLKRERVNLKTIIGRLIGDTAEGSPDALMKRWMKTAKRRNIDSIEDAEYLVSRVTIEIVAIANVQLLGDDEDLVRANLKESGYSLPRNFRLLDLPDSMAIAGFRLLKFYKPVSSHPERPVDPSVLDAITAKYYPFRGTEVVDMRIEVQQILRTLSDRRAGIIVARHVQGARVCEIANQLQVSAETVRRELRAGEKELHKLFATT